MGAYIYYLSKYDPQLALEEIDQVLEVLERVKAYCVWSIADFKRIKGN